MQRIISILFVLCVLTACAGSPSKSSNTIPEITFDEYGEHLMDYFLDKNDQIIYETINIYRNKEYAELLEQVDNMILFFFYGVKTDDITRYNRFKEIVQKNKQQELIKIFNFIENNDLALFIQQQEPSPELNDVYWVLYFSSGNVQYLDHLLTGIMQYYNETKDANLYLTARSAMWSIASNAMTYSPIREYVTSNKILSDEIRRYILNTDPGKIEDETVIFVRQQSEKGIW